MNHFYLFMIISIAHATCMAMEKETNILTELTTTQTPCFAQYLTHDRVVIVGEKRDLWNYKSPATIIDLKIVNPENNQVIKQILNDAYNSCSTYLAIHPNKQKFALSFANQIAIYNSETGKEEWLKCIDDYKTVITHHTFSPINNAIFVTCERKGSRYIKKYNYVTDIYNWVDTGHYLLSHIALHPTQEIMCGGTKKQGTFFYCLLFLYNRNKDYHNVPCDATHYQYNHDGSLVAAYDQNRTNLYIITPPPMEDYKNPCSMYLNKLTPREFAQSKYCGKCGVSLETTNSYPHNRPVRSWDLHGYIKKMLFYPQSSILAILKKNKDNQVIEYLDVKLQKILHTSQLTTLDDKYNICYDHYYDLSFSPDKTKLLVTYDGKCVILPVPLQVRLFEFYYIYLLLKNYQLDGQELPNDIIRLLMNIIFPNT